jgi:TonB family protein
VSASSGESLPRRFGVYLLTSFLGEDVLGRVYRAIRLAPERVFTRVRIFEAPDISEDAVLDAIEENGEIHTFLKNPAITRGVDLDAVDGTPFLAWNEESGRTLDGVIVRVRESRQTIPYEHALLIAEKVATALDHAYNTTVDGERTVHGLVWPGFVSISDDGETRLTGFGLAEGFLPSLGRPRFAKEIAPYLAHEEKASGKVGKNSDVYSVGAILFELLAGRLPNAADPLADLKTVRRDGAPLAPEPAAVLRMCLGQASDRFQSSGELRRELGKLLFSGPYAPSTFNLAFFLNGLFGAEIDSENESRVREAALDPGEFGAPPPTPEPPEPDPLPPRIQTPPGYVLPHRPDEPAYVRDRTPPRGMPGPRSTRPLSAPPPRRRVPFAIGGALLALAAVVGGAWVVLRRQNPPVAVALPVRPTAVPVAPTEPPALPTPARPTNAMSDAQFKEEVAKRVSSELKKMEQDMRKSAASAAAAPASTAPAVSAAAKPKGEPGGGAAGRTETPVSAASTSAASGTAGRPAAEPTAAPVERDPVAGASAGPAQSPSPPPEAPEESTAFDAPPKILRIIKPVYPPVALRAGLKGTVILRVSVSETGRVTNIQVLKTVPGGLTDSAVSAVRGWRFEAATRGGVPVPGVITIPIPFEP